MDFNIRKITKKQIALIIIFIIEGAAVYGLWNLYSVPQTPENITKINTTPVKYVYKPSVNIGCSRLVGAGAQIHLSGSTNMKTPKFQWLIDNTTIGTDRSLTYSFNPGEYSVLLKAESGNDSVKDEIKITAVNSTAVLSAEAVAGSMINERVFITKVKDTIYYIDGVSIQLDGKDRGAIPECRKMTVSGLSGGEHTWKAAFQGKEIGSGSFKLESISKIKITRIDIEGSYHVGDTVKGKIFLQNIGTLPVKGYSLKTLVVNHKFEWMGDISKKEFVSNFDGEIKPGESVEIPVNVKIPEKVSGIKPVGDYSITIQLIINDKVEDAQTVKTVVV